MSLSENRVSQSELEASISGHPQPLKVMVVIGNFMLDSGGAQRAIANQIQCANGEDYQYNVVNLFGSASLARELPTHANVSSVNAVHALDPRTFVRLSGLIRDLKPDLIHTHSAIAGFWGRLIGRWLGIPVVSTEQNSHHRFKMTTKWLNGLTLPLASAITCVSESVKDSFFPWENWLLKRTPIDVIHNAVDVERFSSIVRDGNPELRQKLGFAVSDILLGNVARLNSQKNQHFLIREFETTAAQCPDAHLLLIGKGELRDSLLNLVAGLRLEDRVHLLGSRSDMFDIYRMLDVFVMPSKFEGFSVALLEAMAAGLPIVCSNIPQIIEATGESSDVVDITRSGLLAMAMTEMAKDEHRRSRFSFNAKQRIKQRFNSQEMRTKYESLYRKHAGISAPRV